jgi:flagellar hook assembly protein FlgD
MTPQIFTNRTFMNHIVSAIFLSALLAAPLSAAFTLTGVSPRIFSPAESLNTVNRAKFHFTNPDGAEVTIRIFDITGSLVRRNLDSESAGIMFWNGRNQSGAMVKAGIYIYQVEAGDNVLTGTVVVAK